ncbi:hypothetical protein [Spiroplasma sp. AdecLV25b]|uniref:hypothetical protein n=1 Tax=Spiroplasma sp. AdecLV25b TaxID=3027162 RepID=UPI0027E1A519|nr:hypothetical protein [Spiroplasma sp. AdecLV25b]
MNIKDIVTLVFSILAILVSIALLIYNIYNFKWNKHNNYIKRKQIIIESFNKHKNELINLKYDNIQDFNYVVSMNYEKNKISLINTLNIVKSCLFDSELFYESMFYCQSCRNFYKPEAIKLILEIIKSDLYGYGLFSIIKLEINNKKDFYSNTSEFLSFVKKQSVYYSKYFDLEIELFSQKNNLKEFQNYIFCNTEDKCCLSLVSFLKHKNDKNNINNSKIPKIKTYVETYYKCFYDKKFKKYIEDYFESKKWTIDINFMDSENFIDLNLFTDITNKNSYLAYLLYGFKSLNYIPEEEWIKNYDKNKVNSIFKKQKYTKKEFKVISNLKVNKNILFFVSKCHFCLFDHLAFEQIIPLDILRKFLKSNIKK